jgi:hypothetical protein
LTYTRVVPAGSRGEISSLDAPSSNERTALTTRMHDLRGSMGGADRATIETLVGSLLAGYPSGRGHRDDPDAVLKMFVQALSGLPSWAISSACSAWNRGEVSGKNASFAPAPADLRELALQAAGVFSRELLMISKILTAEVVEERESPELRAEVAKRMRAFAERLGADDRKPVVQADPINPVDDYNAWQARTLDEIRVESKTGRYQLSDNALKAAGLTPNKDARAA